MGNPRGEFEGPYQLRQHLEQLEAEGKPLPHGAVRRAAHAEESHPNIQQVLEEARGTEVLSGGVSLREVLDDPDKLDDITKDDLIAQAERHFPELEGQLNHRDKKADLLGQIAAHADADD